jgi:hypothetical protein
MAVRLEVEHEALVTDAASVWSASALSALIDLIVPTIARSLLAVNLSGVEVPTT